MSPAPRRPGAATGSPRETLPERIIARISRQRSPQIGDLRLTQRNVFVLPTRAGLLYAAALLAMLLASINYALALGFMLTFLLGGVAMVAMLHTFRNLSTLVLRPGRAEPVFAGQPAELSLMLINRGRLERFALALMAQGMKAPEVVDVPSSAEQLVRIAIPASRRGWLPVQRITIRTEFPIGLWRAWTWWQPAMSVLVYPTPETPATPLPDAAALSGEGAGMARGEDDISGVRPYREGDSPRRIAWRAMASTAAEGFLSKEFEGARRGELRLDWNALPGSLDVEARVSRLTRWVIDADAAGARWSLVLPGVSMPLDGGSVHRDRCLEALATMQA